MNEKGRKREKKGKRKIECLYILNKEECGENIDKVTCNLFIMIIKKRVGGVTLGIQIKG